MFRALDSLFFLFLGSKLVDAKIDVRVLDWEFSSCRAFDGLPGRFFPDWAVVIAEVRSALAVANNLGGGRCILVQRKMQ